MKTPIQQEKIDIEWLYARGWTLRQAARELGRSANHVAAVVRGERLSKTLLDQLRSLPKRQLRFR